jgi:hypothetical protein
MSDVDSVGYFAWIDDTHLARSCSATRRKKEPHTLRVVDVTSQAKTIVARNSALPSSASRDTSIQLSPWDGEDHFGFFILRRRRATPVAVIDRSGRTGRGVAGEHHAALVGDARSTPPPLATGAAWRPVRDFAADGIAGITRIAVAPIIR